jgi:hypothetical protein
MYDYQIFDLESGDSQEQKRGKHSVRIHAFDKAGVFLETLGAISAKKSTSQVGQQQIADFLRQNNHLMHFSAVDALPVARISRLNGMVGQSVHSVNQT